MQTANKIINFKRPNFSFLIFKAEHLYFSTSKGHSSKCSDLKESHLKKEKNTNNYT